VPSDAFPAAQINWELQSKNMGMLYSSTFTTGEEGAESDIMESEFGKALHKWVIVGGFSMTVVLFATLSGFGLPVMFVYGLIRGFGQLPHYMLLEVVGALVARYYFHKKFGARSVLRSAPTIMAGYFTGVGLIGMATVAMKLISEAISRSPF